MVLMWERPRFDLTSKAVGGEEASTGEVLDATLESMRLGENANSRLVAFERAYDKRIDEIKGATGRELNNPVSSGAGGPSTMAGFGVQEETDPHAEFQSEMERLAEQHPEQREIIAPHRPVSEDAKALTGEAEKRSEDVWSRSSGGLAAWSARLGGGFYGAMHDPVNIFTMGVGPAGHAAKGVKGLLWMGLMQGAANAGTEAAIQPFVQSWRKEAGLEYGLGQAALNVGAAGAFGFVLDAGVRGGIRGVRRAAGRPYLGPDEPAAPSGGEATGASLPGLPEGKPVETAPPAPRAYRGADPIPPMEALERAAKSAPEGSVLRRAADGDEAALRDLAKELGPDADPSIRRALDELEIEKLFPTPLDVDDGAHLESLARAIRHESGAADLPAGDAIAAPIRREIANIADEAVGRALEVEGRPVGFRPIDPRSVTTDASTFQFKSGGDTAGVTDRLRGVTRFDPVSAGKTIVFERADGSMVIADGHQRLGLAKRVAAEGQDARLDAYVFREADGWTPEDVRDYAALKNMRESSGTSIDMAQVMRDRPDLIDGSLPLTDAKLKEAAMLARLSPEAFDAVVAGRLPPPFAALIGESVADATRHGGLLDEMAAAGLANTQQARLYLKQLMELPTTVETQMTLFGEETFTRTVLIERAQVLDSALRTLKADKRIFGLLRDQARAIEGAGNVLARDANQAKAESAAQLAELIENLATSRGTVATILNDAAASVARGLDAKLASRAFVDRIADTLEREGLSGLVKVDEAPKPDLAPVRMDDPLGPEAKAQAEDVNWALELNDEIMFAIRAYHGTRHDFDRFDLGKIGTGEGDQVFGHGLYFAENEQVGLKYKADIGGSDIYVDGKPFVVGGELVGTTGNKPLDDALAMSAGDVGAAIQGADQMARVLGASNPAAAKEQAEIADALRDFTGDIETRDGGLIYEVDIDVEPHQLLDHDAKLADQPEMLAKVAPLLEHAGSDVAPNLLRTQPGSWVYSELEALLGSADAASQALKDAGIPGLRYLDEGSRMGGSDTRNIVIFDDSLIKITKKNGEAVTAKERQDAVDAMFGLRGGDQTQTPAFRKWFGGSKVVDAEGEPLVVYHGTTAPALEQFKLTKFGAGDTEVAFFTDKPFIADEYNQSIYGADGGATYPVYISVKNPLIIDLKTRPKLFDVPNEFYAGANAKAFAEAKNLSAEKHKRLFGRSAIQRLLTKYDTPEKWRDFVEDVGFSEKGDPDAAAYSKLTEAEQAALYDAAVGTKNISDIFAEAKAGGHDGVILKNVVDTPGHTVQNQYIVFEPTQIKSAIGNRDTFDPTDPRIAFSTPARNATLHNTTLSARASDEMASIRAEIDNAVAKSLPAGWRAEVRQSLVFGDLSTRVQKRNPGIPPSLAIEGAFDPYERIIYVSMAALDPVERAFEEAGHALKAMRLVPEADYGILQAKALEIGAREKFRIDERYGDVYGARWKDDPARLEEALEEEAIMQMVAARARGDDFGKQSNAILDKLVKFLRAIRDMLGLKGFRTFEDVFEDMTEGGFARAMDAQRGGAGAGRPIGGEVMAAGPGKTAAGGETRPTLTEIIADDMPPGMMAFEIHRPGVTQVGFINGTIDPKDSTNFVITSIAMPGGANDIGTSAMRDVWRQLKMLHPEMETVSGTRNTGARQRAGVVPGSSQSKMKMRLPSTALESPTATDASFIARAETASEIMFALGDEGKGKTPEGKSPEESPDAGGEAKPAPARAAAAPSPSAPVKTSAPILPGGRESKRIRNLINQAAAEGKLPREDAQALIERYDALEQFHKDGGKAKQQIAKELTAEAEHRKRQKAIAEQRRRAITAMMTGFRDARGQADPAKAMQALIENLGQHELPQGFVDVAGHQRAIYGLALADLDTMLSEFRKTLITGQTRNKARLANVVRELHGEATGDELSAGFAQAVAKVMEDLRLRFNAAGGNIAKRKDWSMPQSHDRVAMLKGGKQAWVEFITPLLDLKWMKHPLTGDDMPPADVAKTLGDVWDNLVSDGWHEREASMAFRGLSAIANSRADPRSLIFANADAWMKYSARFGSGDDALAILVSHIRGMTKDIAAMEVLGPNPKAMLTYMGQFVEQQAKLRRAGMPAHFPTVTEITGRSLRAGGGILARDPVEGYAKSMIARAENMWNIYSGAASAPVNATLAAASQTVKNINVATKLGGATVSALSDPFWQIAARKFAGLPATKIISDMVKQIGSAGEREARRAGVIAETYLHLHNEGAREGAALSATKISAYVADRVLSLSMLNAVTRYGNHAMSMGIQGHLADMAGKAFPELDPRLQRMFRRWGLEATDWDAIRLDASGGARDVDFLSPADIRRQLVDNGGDPSIAERYLAMTLGEAQYATLTGSIRGQAMVYGSLRAGTAQRELWSMFMQFKSFAVNLAILQIERIAREFVANGLWRGAQYAAYALTAATVGGALIEQLQQLRNGKDPRDMTSPEFWGSAAIRSGGLSIWGDLLYASENRFGGGVASTIAGPSASSLNDILNLTYGSAKKAVLFTDGKDRTNFGREATNFVKRYTPGASLWYVRAAWERVVMDNLQRMVDPEAEASFRRKIGNAKRDYKQEFWWKPGGGAIPQRGPRLDAVLPSR